MDGRQPPQYAILCVTVQLGMAFLDLIDNGERSSCSATCFMSNQSLCSPLLTSSLPLMSLNWFMTVSALGLFSFLICLFTFPHRNLLNPYQHQLQDCYILTHLISSSKNTQCFIYILNIGNHITRNPNKRCYLLVI